MSTSRIAFIRTLVSDGIIVCFPVVIPNALKTWPAPAAIVIAWTLMDLMSKRLSKTGSRAFNACIAVSVGAVVLASIYWGHTGDVPNVRILYLVFMPLVIAIHAVVVARNSVTNTDQAVKTDVR
jgi:hypothetical protein